MTLRVGSLFSGIGGIDLGLERAGFEIAWQVEKDAYCRQVLARHWPRVPCHCDITRIRWDYVQPVDLVCGGFPCQPFSLAGKRQGARDDRYLWPEVVRCLDALRPTWFLGENVPGLINLGLDQVCADLEGLGYAVWPVCIPACAVDAPHIRQRIWILAHAARDLRGSSRDEGSTALNWSDPLLANAEKLRWRQGNQDARGYREGAGQKKKRPGFADGSWWAVEPSVGRVAARVPHRVDRLRALGNAVVPQVVEALGQMIIEAERGAQ